MGNDRRSPETLDLSLSVLPIQCKKVDFHPKMSLLDEVWEMMAQIEEKMGSGNHEPAKSLQF